MDMEKPLNLTFLFKPLGAGAPQKIFPAGKSARADGGRQLGTGSPSEYPLPVKTEDRCQIRTT
jgi:hypothetical protein